MKKTLKRAMAIVTAIALILTLLAVLLMPLLKYSPMQRIIGQEKPLKSYHSKAL